MTRPFSPTRDGNRTGITGPPRPDTHPAAGKDDQPGSHRPGYACRGQVGQEPGHDGQYRRHPSRKPTSGKPRFHRNPNGVTANDPDFRYPRRNATVSNDAHMRTTADAVTATL